MAQSTARPSSAPTIYLTGFRCLPGDREYFEAQRTTGSATPYWFKERLVYEGLRAEPRPPTSIAAVSKSDITNTHVQVEKVKTVEGKAQEKRESVREEEERRSGTKGEKTDNVNTKERQEKRDKGMKPDHPKPQKSRPDKTKTVPLPGKRVRFVWSIAIMRKRRRVLHAPCANQLASNKLPTHGDAKEMKRENNNQDNSNNKKIATNQQEPEDEEDADPLHPLVRFPYTPNPHQPPCSMLSDPVVVRRQHQKGEETQTMPLPARQPSEPQDQTQTQAQLQLRRKANTNRSNSSTRARDGPGVRSNSVHEDENDSGSWYSFLRDCWGKRK